MDSPVKNEKENIQFYVNSAMQNKIAWDVFTHLMGTLCSSNDQRKMLIKILMNALKNCKDRETDLIQKMENVNITTKQVETNCSSTQTVDKDETIEVTTQTDQVDSNKKPTIETSYASTQTVNEHVESIEATTQTNVEDSIVNSPIEEFIKDQPMFSPESSDTEHPDPLKETNVKIEHAEIFINEIFNAENLPLDIPNPNDLNSVPVNVDEKFKCEKCNKTFHNKSNLRRHSKLKHQDEDRDDRVENLSQHILNQNDMNSISKEDHQFICEVCDELFQTKSNLYKHRTLEHADNLPLTIPLSLNLPLPDEIPKENDSNSSTTTNDEKFECNKCGKKLNNEYYLKRHLRAKHPEVLSSRFSTRIHSQKKSFKCDKCNKTMANKASLEKHFSLAHSKMRMLLARKLENDSNNHQTPNNVTTCQNCFNKCKDLTKHLLYCKKEIDCKTCGRTFTTASYRTSHRELCDPNFKRSKDELTCKFCGYVFLVRRRLLQHGYKFENGSCSSKFNPSRHLRASFFDDGNPKGAKEKEKKICNICAKVFTHTKTLNEHLERTHGENIKLE